MADEQPKESESSSSVFSSGLSMMNSVADSASSAAASLTSPSSQEQNTGTGGPSAAIDIPKEDEPSIVDDALKLASSAGDSAAEAASSVAKTASDAAASAYKSVPTEQKEMVEAVVKKVETKTSEALAAASQFSDEVSEQITAEVERRILEKLHEVFGVVGDSIKEGNMDPDAPEIVMDGIGFVTDKLLDEIEYEVTLLILQQLRESRPNWDEGEPHGCCPNPFRKFRSVVLYTMYPYDKSIFAQTKDPLWWTITVVSMIPVYGCLQIIYTLNYIMMDRGDEFQLITFMLAFKSANFLSQGLIAAIVGAGQYYFCSNKNSHSCNDKGPGQTPMFDIDMVFFVFQIFLLWHATWCLPYSTKKGTVTLKKREGAHTAVDDEIESKDCCGNVTHPSRGGVIWKFVVYDAIVFVICLALIGYAATHTSPTSDQEKWRFHATVYWTRCLYGFFSLPFFIFGLGAALFTHSVPTAYNENGMLVPILSREESLEKRAKMLAGATVTPAPESKAN